MIVTAIKRGFYDGIMRKPGDKFDCKTDQEFSANWMKKGDAVVKKIDNSKVKSTLEVVHERLEIPDFTKEDKEKRLEAEAKKPKKVAKKKVTKKTTKKAD